jgi:hypothetical protein
MSFTENELLKALGEDEEKVEDEGIAADLTEEEKPVEEAPAEEVAEEKPAEEEKVEEEPTEETPAEEKPADTEPAQEEPAEEEKPVEEPKLILGKFKSQEDLEKAYQNLEKKFGEKAKEVKEVAQATGDDFDKAVNAKIAEETWKVVDKAFETITDPEHAKEAQYLLMQFKRTGDANLLEQARGYLDARVDRRLEVDSMNVAARIQQTANAHRQEILLKPLSDELDKMAEEDPDFMNDEQNQTLMAMAIKLNPATVDVRAVKKAIKEYKELSYKKGYEAAQKEFAKQAEKKAVSIKSQPKVEIEKPKKSYDEMTIEEQLGEEYKSML